MKGLGNAICFFYIYRRLYRQFNFGGSELTNEVVEATFHILLSYTVHKFHANSSTTMGLIFFHLDNKAEK